MESAEKRAGGESVLAKLSELMFIEVVRRYLQTLPPEQAGWLAGLRDPFIGKALSLMHARPAQGLDDRGIGQAGRAVAFGPGGTLHRISSAFRRCIILPNGGCRSPRELLSGGSANVAAIAAEIGYESEAAFSRAFKKMMGVPPSLWRSGLRPGA